MKYYSTNHQTPDVDLQEAVIKGLAADKGLFMPERINILPASFYENMPQMTLQEVSLAVAQAFFGEDIPSDKLKQIVFDTMSFDIPLVKVSDNIYSLELFHGPTLAFKDVGARFMARTLGYFVNGQSSLFGAASAKDACIDLAESRQNRTQSIVKIASEREQSQACLNYAERERFGAKPNRQSSTVNVLVATSGDTGSAVANGFLGVPGIHVYVLYPKGKVSLIQEKQFTTLGQNITALEVDGTFDDCQRLVKSAFMDADLNAHMKLTSANSINVARFLPQAFYYFWAVAQFNRQSSLFGSASAKDACIDLAESRQNRSEAQSSIVNRQSSIVCCVPSGNFGNITAGLFGKRMGLPISRFIAANNRNDIFYNYLLSGQYNPRPSVATLANAMDVGDPSNFARVLALYDNSHEAICADISGATYNDGQIADEIRRVYETNGYLLDPHGACGHRALREGLRPGEVGFFIETAHPAKFKDTVEAIIGEPVAIPQRLQDFMKGTKQSIDMTRQFDDFKAYLLQQ